MFRKFVFFLSVLLFWEGNVCYGQMNIKRASEELPGTSLYVYENGKGKFGYKNIYKKGGAYIKACFDEASNFIKTYDGLFLAAVRNGNQWFIIDNKAEVKYTFAEGSPKPILHNELHYIINTANGIEVGKSGYQVVSCPDKTVILGTEKQNSHLFIIDKNMGITRYSCFIPNITTMPKSHMAYYYSGPAYELDANYDVIAKWDYVEEKKSHILFRNKDNSAALYVGGKYHYINALNDFKDIENWNFNALSKQTNGSIQIYNDYLFYTYKKATSSNSIVYRASGKCIGECDLSRVTFCGINDGLVKVVSEDSFGFVDLRNGFVIPPIIKKSGRCKTTDGKELVVVSSELSRKSIMTPSEYDKYLYEKTMSSLRNSEEIDAMCDDIKILNTYLEDTQLHRNEKSYYDVLFERRKVLQQYVMNISLDGGDSIGWTGGNYYYSSSLEEYEEIDGNFYTFTLSKYNGFIIRYNGRLDKREFVFSLNGDYKPLSANDSRPDSDILIDCASLAADSIGNDHERLKLIHYFRTNEQILLIYDYRYQYYDYESVDRNIAILNNEGVQSIKNLFYSTQCSFISKGDEVFIIDDNNLTCVDFESGSVKFTYYGDPGTKICDVIRTYDGKYVAVGSTKNKGYIDFENPYAILLDKNGNMLTDAYVSDKGVRITSAWCTTSGIVLTCYDNGYERKRRMSVDDNNIILGTTNIY